MFIKHIFTKICSLFLTFPLKMASKTSTSPCDQELLRVTTSRQRGIVSIDTIHPYMNICYRQTLLWLAKSGARTCFTHVNKLTHTHIYIELYTNACPHVKKALVNS